MPDETSFAYFEASRHYFERYGKPVAFYSDKHGIFRVNQEQTVGLSSGLTQFGRAMQNWTSKSSVPIRPKPKDGSNAPTRPCKIAW